MFREPISQTADLASGRQGRWSEGIAAVCTGGGTAEASILWVFVLTMALAFNTVGLACAWMAPLQDLVLPFSTMPGQTRESPSRRARQALLGRSFQRKARSGG